MGALRLTLAFAVVIAHSGPIFGFVGIAAAAVPAFFVISGFYMTLILDTKYQGPNRLSLFYSNRALRLFPVYWTFLLLHAVLAFALVTGHATPWAQIIDHSRVTIQYATDGSLGAWLAAIPNLTFFGADTIRMFGIDVTTQTVIPLWRWFREAPTIISADRFLVMPQIWSLGVELAFYAVAPFMVGLRTRTLFIIFAWSVLAHYVMARVPIQWLTVSLPFNFGYFILGMLVYRYSKELTSTTSYKTAIAAMPFFFCIAWPLILPFFPTFVGRWLLFALFAACLPALFDLTKNARFDRKLGDLSYPVYLCHTLFVPAATTYGPWAAFAVFFASCALSWVAVKLIDEPIDLWRQRRAMQAAAAYVRV